jgi:hypothetical protein
MSSVIKTPDSVYKEVGSIQTALVAQGDTLVGNVTGYALNSVAVTATSNGLTTGIIPAGATHVVVTSANANNIVTLPEPVPGLMIHLINAGTGYEIRSSAPATIAINGGAEANAESAVAANILVRLYCVSATAWIGQTFTTAGVVGVLEVAAAA